MNLLSSLAPCPSEDCLFGIAWRFGEYGNLLDARRELFLVVYEYSKRQCSIACVRKDFRRSLHSLGLSMRARSW